MSYEEKRDSFFNDLDDRLSKAEIGFKAYEKGYEQAKSDILELIDNLDLFVTPNEQTLIVRINQLGRKGADN